MLKRKHRSISNDKFTSPWVRRTPRSAVKSTPFSVNRRKELSITANVKVCVRIRPYGGSVATSNAIVNVIDDHMLLFDPPPTTVKETYFKGESIRDPTSRRAKNLTFCFDRVFDIDAKNEIVYKETMEPILEKFLNGHNCSMFAYGATGSGKTFTMLGSSASPGVILLTLEELYFRLQSENRDYDWELHVSYIEIYNEKVYDLLRPNKPVLNLREGKEVLISELSYHTPKSTEEMTEILIEGNKRRTQHPTDKNQESSRSHAVFQVTLKQTSKIPEIVKEVLFSKLSMIDLAGSERCQKAGLMSARQREGSNINRSLLALANCISALSEGRRGAHVPYRDSKLTRILKDSLSGRCYTIMIATINTLQYANRAKNIRTDTTRNILKIDRQTTEYIKIIKEQKKMIEELKAKNLQLTQEIEMWKNNNITVKNELDHSLPRSFQEPMNDVNITPAIPPKKRLSLLRNEDVRTSLADKFNSVATDPEENSNGADQPSSIYEMYLKHKEKHGL
ncbi:Kinesin-like protein KIF18B [Trichinella patagoniensis]|uniref:Kinesin-like protein n=1 Tax=Trichinella patagoniensis TaxID=990121 RepID=A0A0V0ZJK7_9BILA|nr:Kinesin-like protein KIF18B [Trichinella patagoniensis]